MGNVGGTRSLSKTSSISFVNGGLGKKVHNSFFNLRNREEKEEEEASRKRER